LFGFGVRLPEDPKDGFTQRAVIEPGFRSHPFRRWQHLMSEVDDSLVQ
jgi:hypothetical protein